MYWLNFLKFAKKDQSVIPTNLDHKTQYGQVRKNCHIRTAHAYFSIARPLKHDDHIESFGNSNGKLREHIFITTQEIERKSMK